MNKPALFACTALLLSGCGLGGDANLQAEDIEDYLSWKESQTEVEIEPFKANPIRVKGIGTVRAAPDIAVLTGVIKSKANVDYKAMDASAQIINRVQNIIDGKDIEISFTNISSVEKRDESCVAHNVKASRRHSDINTDNRFNKRELNRPKDVRQKLREPKSRILWKICEVTHVENVISFTAWVRPSGEVSDYIRAFTEAGVEQVNLFGFDFSNYDALYKEASEKAVKNAREKAEISARIAGTKLTTIETFSVTGTERRSRFGRQASIISPHGNRSLAPKQRRAFSDRIIREQAAQKRRAESRRQSSTRSSSRTLTCPDGSRVSDINFCPVAQMVQPAPLEAMTCWDGTYVMNAGQCPAQPAFEPSSDVVTVSATKRTNRAVGGSVPEFSNASDQNQSGNTQSNALRETMLSGSKTIRVSATLSYNYETPLDGVIFKVPEED